MKPGKTLRRLPVGAEIQPGGVHFRVWATGRQQIEVVIEGEEPLALRAEGGGYYSALVPGAGAGTRYRFRLDRHDYLYPDPASRCQPEGPHGPSQVVDPAAFHWT